MGSRWGGLYATATVAASNLLMSLLVLTGFSDGCLAYGQSCNINDPTAPCFTGVKDILNGQRTLLQDDDLLFAGNVSSNDPSGFSSVSTIFTTAGSHVSPLLFTNYTGQGATSNAIANTARMFSSSGSVAVTAVGGYGGGFSAVETYYRQLASGSVTNFSFVPIMVNSQLTGNCLQKLYSVAADFTGNGYDDLVFGAYFPTIGCTNTSAGIMFQTVAAQNPANPSSGYQTGPASQLFTRQSTLFALAAGTFTEPPAKGPAPLPQIAMLTTNNVTGNGLQISIYSVDPPTLAVSYTGKSLNLTLPEGISCRRPAGALAAARRSRESNSHRPHPTRHHTWPSSDARRLGHAC